MKGIEALDRIINSSINHQEAALAAEQAGDHTVAFAHLMVAVNDLTGVVYDLFKKANNYKIWEMD